MFGHENIFGFPTPDYAYRPLFYSNHNSIPCCKVNYITGFIHTDPDVQCYCTVGSTACCVQAIPISANRLGAALHLDDLCKFFEDANGGRDCTSSALSRVSPGDVVGCGYEFGTGALFFNPQWTPLAEVAERVCQAFTCRASTTNVYDAIGLEGVNGVEVDFGSTSFRWREGSDMTC